MRWRLPMSVNFYLNYFFPIRFCLIFMKLGVNDMRASGYKVLEKILNICINYANQINFSNFTKQQKYFSQQADC